MTMSDQPTEKPQGQQPTPAAQQQPQTSGYQPNRNVQPPQYQIVTEGYDPRADITRKDKNG
jgi:hypothetical protein